MVGTKNGPTQNPYGTATVGNENVTDGGREMRFFAEDRNRLHDPGLIVVWWSGWLHNTLIFQPDRPERARTPGTLFHSPGA
jgi:hypothetical protein